jgi:hypothetical protein
MNLPLPGNGADSSPLRCTRTSNATTTWMPCHCVVNRSNKAAIELFLNALDWSVTMRKLLLDFFARRAKMDA